MRQKFIIKIFLLVSVLVIFGSQTNATIYPWVINFAIDKDGDLIPDRDEVRYGTNPLEYDSDKDGYLDGDEVNRGFDPAVSGLVPLTNKPKSINNLPGEKIIEIDLSDQKLTYYEGSNVLGSFLISSANALYTTPTGEFEVQAKRPVVLYAGYNRDGSRYNYPNTKWNLQFLPHYYIHGAYWHNNFGRPMSHGCVNVSYANMEGLYSWAEVGTKVLIHQ